MKKRDIQMVFDAMSKIAEKKYPEKKSAEEQFRAYGKIGLLTFCYKRGFGYGEYLDLLERISV